MGRTSWNSWTGTARHYYVVIQIVLQLGLNTNDLKLLTALVVALFLSIPHLKGRLSSHRRREA